MKLILVWWWRLPKISFWKYPHGGSGYYKYSKKPIFWGLYLGIVELRLYPKIVIRRQNDTSDTC